MTENEHLKQIIYYKTENGRCPYDEWLDSLDNKIKSIIENLIVAGSDKSDQKRIASRGRSRFCLRLKAS